MRWKMNRSGLRLLLVVVVLVVVAVVLFSALRAWENKQYQVSSSSSSDSSGASETAKDPYAGEDEAMTYLNGKWYTKRNHIETVLLIGLDKFEDALPADSDSYVNNQQADFLLLLLLDHEHETYTALHINRDSMAEIRILGVGGVSIGTKTAQLALAHTYGGGRNDSCRNTTAAVSGFLYGTKIDHYVSVTMDAVADLNDLVGGVKISVLDDLTPVDEKLVQGANVTLTGKQALSYVRARGSLADSSNLRRMERQRQYLSALQRQMDKKATESEDFLLETILHLSPYLVSDCTVNQLADIGNAMMAYRNEGIQTIEGNAVKGAEYMEFYADENALKAMVIDLLYTETENA